MEQSIVLQIDLFVCLQREREREKERVRKRERGREDTLDILYPSDNDKNNVKLLEPHLLLLSFSSLLLFFFLVVVVVVVSAAAAAATVKRRIYEQFASRSRALNVRHELTRHSPQEQAVRAGGAAGNGAAIADDFVNATPTPKPTLTPNATPCGLCVAPCNIFY